MYSFSQKLMLSYRDKFNQIINEDVLMVSRVRDGVSCRVKPDILDHVRRVSQSMFARQLDLATRSQMGLDTVNNFLTGDCVRRGTAMDLCEILKLDFNQVCERCGQVQIETDLPPPLYIERYPLEKNCYQEILQPGNFMRIKAPKYSGQGRLISYLIRRLRQENNNYRYLVFDFQSFGDRTVFEDLVRFYQCFCRALSDKLSIDISTDWDEKLGCNWNVSNYFKNYLLGNISNPLVLILTHVDLVFEHPQIYPDFCNLLRSFADAARVGDNASTTWQKLRLVIVHSTDVYGLFDINSSPLAGAGKCFQLRDFNETEVRELVKGYQLDLDDSDITRLMDELNGHPYLTAKALQFICDDNTSLEQVLENASTQAGIFASHLQCIWESLENNEALLRDLKQVVTAPPAEIETSFKLESMGLIKLSGNLAESRCAVYQRYFKSRLP